MSKGHLPVITKEGKTMIRTKLFGAILFVILSVGSNLPSIYAQDNPKDRAGKWSGSTKCGEFAFVVDPGGKSISLIEFTKLKGLRKSYSLKSQSGISDDGKFNIVILKLLDNITFFGKFSKDADHATGTWKMPSGCSSTWKATKSGPVSSKSLPIPTL